MRVAIGCPVRNRAWILPEYLTALAAVHHPAKRYMFLENDSTDDTERHLRAWAPPDPVTINTVRGEAPGHRRNEYGRDQYAHLAAMRNRFLDVVLATDAAYLLSVDSDVLVPPDILQRLLPLADDRTIVGAAICNIAGREIDGKLPGNFMVEQNGLILHPPSYPLTGTLEVAVTGACCLIPRAVLEHGVRYGPNPQGEDVAFCLAARVAGCHITVSFDVRPQHRMVEIATMA